MAKYTTTDIRNIALTGTAGAGKTTLVETMLNTAGEIGHIGTVEQGNTVCDFDELEKEYDVNFTLNEIYDVVTVADIKKHLKSHGVKIDG